MRCTRSVRLVAMSAPQISHANLPKQVWATNVKAAPRTCSVLDWELLSQRSRPGFRRGNGAAQGARRTDDELLRLRQEEHQSAEEEPRPDPQRDRLVVEQTLQGRCIGKEQLQDRDHADAERQVLVAEVSP
jgi:hypothetical protein